MDGAPRSRWESAIAASQGRFVPAPILATLVLALGHALAVASVVPVALLGCATPAVVATSPGDPGAPGVFEHTRLGYRVSDPAAPGAGSPSVGAANAASGPLGWRRIEVEGADLAFRSGAGAGEATMVVASRCGGPDATLPVLARHLLIGTGPRERTQAGPASVAGQPAWVQWAEVRGEGAPVRLKTVTTRVDGCLVDFVLAATGGFDRAVPDFDRWWASFEPPAEGVDR
ncbi:MAG: hypothetical protein ACQGVK_07530 [Myxococcota bacterium]